MLKLPAYEVTFKHKKTTCVRYVGAHEIPILRLKVRAMGAGDIQVSRPGPNASPEQHWVKFANIESEYSRLRFPPREGGQYGGLVDEAYPTFDDFAEKVNAELGKLAKNGGRNYNVPKEIPAPPALVELVTAVLFPAEAGKAIVAGHGPEDIAKGLATVGIVSVGEVAAASLGKLCSVPQLDAVAADALKSAAAERESRGEAQDNAKGLVEGLSMFDPDKQHDLDNVPAGVKI